MNRPLKISVAFEQDVMELLKTDLRDHGVFRQGNDMYFETCHPGRDYLRIYRSPLRTKGENFGAVIRVLQRGGDSTARISAKRRTDPLPKPVQRKARPGQRAAQKQQHSRLIKTITPPHAEILT